PLTRPPTSWRRSSATSPFGASPGRRGSWSKTTSTGGVITGGSRWTEAHPPERLSGPDAARRHGSRRAVVGQDVYGRILARGDGVRGAAAGRWAPDRYERSRAERAKPFWDLAGLVEPCPGGRVVDLGCGTGELTSELHRLLRAAETVGIDSSPAMLERARA